MSAKFQTQVKGFLKIFCGKDWGAPFVSTTFPMFWSYCHLVEAWLRADHLEQPHIEAAMRSILAVFEHHGHGMRAAQLAIPAIGDWGHVAKLWPAIAPEQFKAKDWRPEDCKSKRFLAPITRAEQIVEATEGRR